MSTKTLFERVSQRDATLVDISLSAEDNEDDIDVYPLLAQCVVNNNIVQSISISDRGPCGDDGIASLANSLPTLNSLKSLTLRRVGLSIDDVNAISGVLPELCKLEKLDLTGNGLDDDGARSLSSVICRCNNLLVIELGDNHISDDGALAIAGVLPKLDQLVCLSLGKLIGKEGLKGIAKAVSSLENLSTLDLSGNNKNGADLAGSLASVLPSLPFLRCLKLNDARIGPRGTKTLVAALVGTVDLRELGMSGCKIGFFGTKAIGAVGLPLGLTDLNISNNGVGDDGAWQLTSSLATLRNLTRLNLASNQLGDDAAAVIARLLPSLKQLLHLDLSSNKDIGDAGVEVLAEALPSIPIQIFALGSNSVGDAGAIALGRVLETSGSLNRLELGNNLIGDDGAIGLAKGIKTNSTLTHLLLKSNRIGDEGAGEFVEHLDTNKSLLILDLTGNPVSSSRMLILDMLLKHRKQLPASRDELSGHHLVDFVSSPKQGISNSAVHSPQQRINRDEIIHCRNLIEEAVRDQEVAPAEISSEFASSCTNNFNARHLLNYGAFGDLFEGVDTLEPSKARKKQEYAVRRLLLGDAGVLTDIRNRVMDELASLKHISHPNIMPFFAYSSEANGTQFCFLYIVQSYEPLNEYLADEDKRKQMTWSVRIKIMKGLINAVNFLHTGGRNSRKKKIRPSYHGDIKSSNCFVNDEDFSAKLVDCGLSRLLATDRDRFQRGDVVFGTRGYRCPRYERGWKYTAECDVFSIGIVIAETITGKLQNHVDSTSTVHDFYYRCVFKKKITLDPLAGPIDTNAARALCQMSLACMNSEPAQRPSPSALLKTLEQFKNCF
mmetsp:Transcript_35220/g.77105  ORF Transcript_35220/g.77105 Transcript_35220/m.77105 type:complete len:835 (-) Transcript_35220:37-2541(-)|eukprot:CAMPEP_0178637610 /NCGR_PEP_ID=MMETSP0698-20121128/14425_1 /TAXON_ID=265572 /ORGANISM="Extubocellulus spinifer, Strain CCMP396" /LENGTH=834 /DNA_ID=CAMNT_0020277695 /DNA_START=157 /DNA_END=2661 /DNA_ORIENTATION=-